MFMKQLRSMATDTPEKRRTLRLQKLPDSLPPCDAGPEDLKAGELDTQLVEKRSRKKNSLD
jgi:hypothetical protein